VATKACRRAEAKAANESHLGRASVVERHGFAFPEPVESAAGGGRGRRGLGLDRFSRLGPDARVMDVENVDDCGPDEYLAAAGASVEPPGVDEPHDLGGRKTHLLGRSLDRDELVGGSDAESVFASPAGASGSPRTRSGILSYAGERRSAS
jgi:hypothetical protein